MTELQPSEVEHDFAYLDALAEQRVAASRAEVLRQAVKLTLAGGAACAMVVASAALLAASVKVQVATVERTVQAPAAQIVEVPKLVSPEIVRPEIVRPEVARVAGEPERRPLSDFPDRTLVGVIVSVTSDQVCIRAPSGGAPGCVQPALVDTTTGKAILDAHGEVQRDPAKEYGPMQEAVGHEAFQAPSPGDPTHLSHYWWKQGDTLVAFDVRPARHASAPAAPHALPEVKI